MCYDRQADTAAAAAAHSAGKCLRRRGESVFTMKIVLKQDVKSIGKKDGVYEVSDGYARNFLFPRGLAVEASASAVNEVKTKAAAKQHHAAEELAAGLAPSRPRILPGASRSLWVSRWISARLCWMPISRHLAPMRWKCGCTRRWWQS